MQAINRFEPDTPMTDEQNKAEASADEILAADALNEALKPEADPKDVEIAALKDEVAASKDRLLRLAAEMENLRKRTEREKAEATLYAATNFARDLLSVSDNLGRALQALPQEERDRAGEIEKNLIAGVEVTERELLQVFQRHGIKKLETVGQKFDPNYHQAIYEIPTSEKPPGIVMQEMQAGYAVGDRCLRPAMVGVSKAEG
jgi:molecular chaperone GrpE